MPGEFRPGHLGQGPALHGATPQECGRVAAIHGRFELQRPATWRFALVQMQVQATRRHRACEDLEASAWIAFAVVSEIGVASPLLLAERRTLLHPCYPLHPCWTD